MLRTLRTLRKPRHFMGWWPRPCHLQKSSAHLHSRTWRTLVLPHNAALFDATFPHVPRGGCLAQLVQEHPVRFAKKKKTCTFWPNCILWGAISCMAHVPPAKYQSAQQLWVKFRSRRMTGWYSGPIWVQSTHCCLDTYFLCVSKLIKIIQRPLYCTFLCGKLSSWMSRGFPALADLTWTSVTHTFALLDFSFIWSFLFVCQNQVYVCPHNQTHIVTGNTG